MPNPGTEPVDIECEFRTRGPSSVVIRVNGAKELRIPTSAIHEDNEFDWEDATRGDKGTLIIHRWLAEKEGLV